MTKAEYWHHRIGNQRDWVWRGWQTRFTFMRAKRSNTTNTPIILIHGFGAAIEHWRKNIPILSENHTVYAIDLLGFGASRKANTDYSINLWVEQVHDFWQTFIGTPAVLIGNSIGSLIALTAAATYPEMAKGLTMLSLLDLSSQQEIIPKWVQPIERTFKAIVASSPLIPVIFQLLRRKGTISNWVKLAYCDRAAITEELVEILAIPPQDEGATRAFSRLFIGATQSSFALPAKVLLPKLKIPTLLLWGTQDRVIPPRLGKINIAEKLACFNPQIDLIELDRAGHCLHDECPDRFNPIILDWLEKIFKNEPKPEPDRYHS